MPKEKSRVLRVVVPLLAIAAAVGVAAAVFMQSRKSPSPAAPAGPAPSSAPAPIESVAATNGGPPAESATPPPGAGAAAEEKAAPPVDAHAAGGGESAVPAAGPADEPPKHRGLHARVVEEAPAALAPIGGLNEDGPDFAQIDFTTFGAGVEAITLARHYDTVAKKRKYRVQERQTYSASGSGGGVTVASLAARGVEINGAFVDLFSDESGGASRPVWRQTAPGEFEAFIDDPEGKPVARIARRYSIAPGSYNIALDQRLFNLTDAPLTVRWYQYGPVDLEMGDIGYGGDKRRVRFGYLPPPARDPSRQIVETDSKLRGREDIIKRAENAYKSQVARGDPGAQRAAQIWPDPDAGQGAELVWAAMTNRYFTFAVHPLPDSAAWKSGQRIDKRLTQAPEVYGVVLGQGSTASLILQMNGPATRIEAGQALDLSMGAYAGPLWRKTLAREDLFRALRLDLLIIYNLGGPCAWCTFQWLARALFWFLGVLHDYLVFDWAIAIMILVVCVRTILHPVTRRSQISLQRFSKQMAALGPKQQKLREKFADDPKRLQQEMVALYRQENVRFSGALGCLPMFLQSPIWIALYAMLYFAFDLRHAPAFFGVFQRLTGGAWTFLGDLSAPDRIIDFGRDIVNLPLLGPIHSINVLPLILGVVFFVQQKYLTPPPSAALTPEQEMQQKIMKWMMVVMFPLLMYNAPSGLAIYFITNSVLGIFESRHIRAHITKLDLEPPKPRADAPGRKAVQNTAPLPGKGRSREGSPYKARGEKKG